MDMTGRRQQGRPRGRRLTELEYRRLVWLWEQTAGSLGAFAALMAAATHPEAKLVKETDVDAHRQRLRRLVEDRSFPEETAQAMARTWSISVATLERLLGRELDELKPSLRAALALMGPEERTRFPVLPLAEALRNYRAQFLRTEGLIQVLSMARPRWLDHIYTPVQVEAPGAFLRLEPFRLPDGNSAKGRPPRGSGLAQDASRLVDGVTMANQERLLTVLGEPGCGKSTLLRRIGCLALERFLGAPSSDYQHACLPVFVELKNFDPTAQSLLEVVESQLLAAGVPAGFGHWLWHRGGLLLLLDGFDEVPEARAPAVAAEVTRAAAGCAQGRILTSCRKAAYRNQFKGFRCVTVADFDSVQIRTFIVEKWFAGASADRVRGTALWRRLSHRRHTAMFELARTPLLLTLLCLVFEAEERLPTNRSRLYEKALRVLLREWAAQKGGPVAPPFPTLTPEWELQLLQSLAGPSFAKNQVHFERRELVCFIHQFVTQELAAPTTTDAGLILDAMRERQGVLVGEEGTYAFSHTTFHEFLAARYFHQSGEGARLAQERSLHERWREVLLLLAGLAEDGTSLLESMLQPLQALWAATPKIKGLLEWAARWAPHDEEGSRLTARRAALLSLARLQSALREQVSAEVQVLLTDERYDLVIARDVVALLAPTGVDPFFFQR